MEDSKPLKDLAMNLPFLAILKNIGVFFPRMIYNYHIRTTYLGKCY
jgi:hypothetical protein